MTNYIILTACFAIAVNLKYCYEGGTKLFPVNVSICKNCGFVFLNPRWSRKRIEYYYENEYDLYHRPMPTADKTIKIKEVYERISQNVDLRKIDNILDIGAGKGDMLSCFRQSGNSFRNLYAIEPSEKCKIEIEKIGGQVISGDIFGSTPLPLGKIDLIILQHAVEHFYDPLQALEVIRSLLSDEGIVYIGIPDVLNPGSPLGYSISHLSYFCIHTLRFACNQVGLKDIFSEESKSCQEIYGFFRKGAKSCVNPDTYKAHKLFIVNNRKRQKINLLKISLKRIAASILPKFILRKILLIDRKNAN